MLAFHRFRRPWFLEFQSFFLFPRSHAAGVRHRARPPPLVTFRDDSHSTAHRHQFDGTTRKTTAGRRAMGGQDASRMHARGKTCSSIDQVSFFIPSLSRSHESRSHAACITDQLALTYQSFSFFLLEFTTWRSNHQSVSRERDRVQPTTQLSKTLVRWLANQDFRSY